MLKGFSTPLSPTGRTSLAPRPPWHYAGCGLVIDYLAAPSAVASVLPPGLLPADNQGRCTAHFFEWQACISDQNELLDPCRSQYREFFILVSALFEGEPVQYCPYIIVDQDISLMRGLIQGLPKQLGSVWITRSVGVRGVASPCIPGGTFGATLAVKDRRIADAAVTLETQCESAPGLIGGQKVVGLRYFPELTASLQESPAVFELVQFTAYNREVSPIWTGSAKLEYFESPCHELFDLRPVETRAGYRYEMSMSVADLRKLRDCRDITTDC